MERPLTSSAEAEEELEWQVAASRRRKAWAQSRGSWQASEAEDLSTEATTQDEDDDDDDLDPRRTPEGLPDAKLPPPAAERGPSDSRMSPGRAGGRADCGVPGASDL